MRCMRRALKMNRYITMPISGVHNVDLAPCRVARFQWLMVLHKYSLC